MWIVFLPDGPLWRVPNCNHALQLGIEMSNANARLAAVWWWFAIVGLARSLYSRFCQLDCYFQNSMVEWVSIHRLPQHCWILQNSAKSSRHRILGWHRHPYAKPIYIPWCWQPYPVEQPTSRPLVPSKFLLAQIYLDDSLGNTGSFFRNTARS